MGPGGRGGGIGVEEGILIVPRAPRPSNVGGGVVISHDGLTFLLTLCGNLGGGVGETRGGASVKDCSS